jgi:DNA mismatch endonuclease (patch repair protein)
MPDSFTRAQRSEIMRRVKSRDTQLEISFRAMLWASGLRYRVRSSLPGKPDLIFPASRVSVFIDSCFWHACPQHCRQPKSNQRYWVEKLRRNRERDLAVTIQHKRLGWKVVRVWEHTIKATPDKCVAKIMTALSRTIRNNDRSKSPRTLPVKQYGSSRTV